MDTSTIIPNIADENSGASWPTGHMEAENDECDSKDVGLRMAVLKTTASPVRELVKGRILSADHIDDVFLQCCPCSRPGCRHGTVCGSAVSHRSACLAHNRFPQSEQLAATGGGQPSPSQSSKLRTSIIAVAWARTSPGISVVHLDKFGALRSLTSSAFIVDSAGNRIAFYEGPVKDGSQTFPIVDQLRNLQKRVRRREPAPLSGHRCSKPRARRLL